MREIGEIGAAAHQLPALSRDPVEAAFDGGAAFEDLRPLARQPLPQMAHPPKRAALADLRGADGDGVEELLDLGQPCAAGDQRADALVKVHSEKVLGRARMQLYEPIGRPDAQEVEQLSVVCGVLMQCGYRS